MSDLVKIEPQSVDMLALIERLAQNPDVDVQKMQAILAMKREVDAEEAKKAANVAFARFQADCPRIFKGRSITVNGQRRSNYAALEDIRAAVDPLLLANGLCVRFENVTNAGTGKITGVRCVVIHAAGHSWESLAPVTEDKGAGRNDIQAIGSAISYGQRYALVAALGLVLTNEDDDGHATSKPDIMDEFTPIPTEVKEAAQPPQKTLKQPGIAIRTRIYDAIRALDPDSVEGLSKLHIQRNIARKICAAGFISGADIDEMDEAIAARGEEIASYFEAPEMRGTK